MTGTGGKHEGFQWLGFGCLGCLPYLCLFVAAETLECHACQLQPGRYVKAVVRIVPALVLALQTV